MTYTPEQRAADEEFEAEVRRNREYNDLETEAFLRLLDAARAELADAKRELERLHIALDEEKRNARLSASTAFLAQCCGFAGASDDTRVVPNGSTQSAKPDAADVRPPVGSEWTNVQREFAELCDTAIRDTMSRTGLRLDELELATSAETPRKAEVRRRGTDEVLARVELKLTTETAKGEKP